VIEIEFYETSNGKCPVAEYLDTLSSSEAQKVAWVIELIQTLERPPSKFLKKLKSTDDLWEIRIQYSGNIFRLLSFFDDEKLLIANHGFTKKSQKTPKNDIGIAEERKKDYYLRKGELGESN